METACTPNKLENLLLDKGVRDFHITRMKNEKTLDVSEYNIYYDLQGERTLKKIPVDRIKTTNRVNPNVVSWFELAFAPHGINLSSDRLHRCLLKFKDSINLQSYYDFFVSDECRKKNPISFNYYDKDNIYTASAGNHRTIFAKITDTPYIKANTDIFTFNQQKYSNYVKLKSAFLKFEKSLEAFNLCLDEIYEAKCISYRGEFFIGVFDNSYLYNYFLFKDKEYYFISSLVSQDHTINDIISDLSLLSSQFYDIEEKSKEYKRLYTLVKWLKKKSVIGQLLLFYHHFQSEKNNLVNDLAFLKAQIDLDLKVKDTSTFV
ncbi:hypothetical protein [Halobacillus litoralis]|uniref:hypothetical protein n=1 Tax=Halobacillus litoralis TaxID=45668 RepID=UPI00137129A2|nr:hypothetical protein [Halobacillus litoralis]MYL37359.1 hypothetical protein [Halobacillus litoralis]